MARICEPRWRLRVVLVSGVVVALVALATPAFADDAKAQAGALLDEGVALYDTGRYEAALDRFQRAYGAYPSPKIYVNIAAALRALGREVEAAQTYERFLAEAAGMSELGEDKKQAARRALAELESRLGRLAIEVEPPEAAVTIDGAAIEVRTGRPTYVMPGRRKVAATAGGVVVREIELEIGAGEVKPVRLARDAAPNVEPREPVGTRPAKPEHPIPVEQLIEAPPSVPARPKRLWTWIAAGSTGALLGGGIFFAARADRAFDDYRTTMDPARYDRLRDQIGRDDRIANVLFVGAGGAAVAAGILFFVEARAAPGAVRTPSIAVELTGRGVAVRGRF